MRKTGVEEGLRGAGGHSTPPGGHFWINRTLGGTYVEFITVLTMVLTDLPVPQLTFILKANTIITPRHPEPMGRSTTETTDDHRDHRGKLHLQPYTDRQPAAPPTHPRPSPGSMVLRLTYPAPCWSTDPPADTSSSDRPTPAPAAPRHHPRPPPALSRLYPRPGDGQTAQRPTRWRRCKQLQAVG